MFTNSTAWHPEENRITRLLKRKRSSGRSIIDLTVSNPTLCGFDPPDDLLRESLSPSNLRYDPDPRGIPPAREAIAAWYKKQDLPVHPDDIVLTSGTSEAYSYLFHLLGDPGESILIPKPGYPLLDDLGRLHRLAVGHYRLEYDGEWRLDRDSFHDAPLTPKAIVLINPNNPTGSFLKDTDWQTLKRIPQQASPLILDEVFWKFSLEEHTREFNVPDQLTFRLNGISKIAALPQMKLAWIVVSGPESEKKEALRRLEIIADMFLSVNTQVQQALPGILQGLANRSSPILARIRRNDAFLKEALEPQLPMSALRCEGGWTAVLRLPATQTGEEGCFQFLDQCDVLLHPGELFDFSLGAFGVISLLTDHRVLTEGIRRIAGIFSSGLDPGTNRTNSALHQ